MLWSHKSCISFFVAIIHLTRILARARIVYQAVVVVAIVHGEVGLLVPMLPHRPHRLTEATTMKTCSMAKPTKAIEEGA